MPLHGLNMGGLGGFHPSVEFGGGALSSGPGGPSNLHSAGLGPGFVPSPEDAAAMSRSQALYHLQLQQQRHLRQQQMQQQQAFQQQPPPGRLQPPPQNFGLNQPPLDFPGHNLASPHNAQFDLSQSMLRMDLNAGGLSENDANKPAPRLSSPSSSDPFASWASASTSSSSSTSSASLRDQMNQQMAALYQRDTMGNPQQQQQALHPQQPLASSGSALLGLLNTSSREFGSSSGSGSFPDLPDLSGPMLGGPPPMMMQQPLSHGNGGGLSRQTRRSPAKPLNSAAYGHRDQGFKKSSSGGSMNDVASSIEVTPEVTKPNGNIKVQVSLLAEACVPGRVLMVGLFRAGQMTNERPIFVKQVLFENKLNRNYRFLNTRITFRAPRSPGEFEFRVFENKRNNNGGTSQHQGAGDADRESSSSSYSNVTLARSNKLKVSMEYSHFIETLRSTHDKFRNAVKDGDVGATMSSLLSILRLIEQVETVFLHGNALFSEFVDSCLQLISLKELTILERFTATDSVPNAMEAFHGSMRNVLNGIQANPFVKELISDDVLQRVDVFQRELYCQVSGFYFQSKDDRRAFWQKHFGFEPLDFALGDDTGHGLLQSPFVREAVSDWIVKEAHELIPDKETFRRTRQAIYNVFHAQVISKLPIKADLDVFGSSANDFGTIESDMDMCLVLEKPATTEEKQQILRIVVLLLERQPDLFVDIDVSRLTARIPIIMFKMKDSGIECDLCVENVLAQRNTSFLRAYANADERVRILAYVIKRFVKKRRMNCAAEGTLSSYGYLLMLIHFLQRQDPPVLPVLQALPPAWDGSRRCDCTPSRVWCSLQSPQCALSERHPEMQLPSVLCKGPAGDNEASSSNGNSGKVETYFFDPFAFQDPPQKLQVLREFGKRNSASAGELLIGFFEYFGLQFDASRQVVSVRMARNLSKEEKKRESQWRMHTRLSIEDPFEIAYDVAHVLKGSRDKYIRQQFAWAYSLLMNGSLNAAANGERSQSSASLNESVAQIMAKINEEVLEPPFLQSHGTAVSAAAGAGEDDEQEQEDENEGEQSPQE
uniref:Uncharacterized protein n=1 Tax=Globisporangium ultimum (strain ATCC 200006 / CBS 805.95 / DAOM BR144) TaxID=431595 RepID=K3W949_GLOUD